MSGLARAEPADEARAPRAWHLGIEGMTDFPLTVGAQVWVEMPYRLRLTMSSGELPDGYLQTINAIAVSTGAYNQSQADLITELLDRAATWRLHFGWRPFSRRGGYIEGGFGLVALEKGLALADVIQLASGLMVPQEARIGLGYEVTTVVETLGIEVGWNLVSVAGPDHPRGAGVCRRRRRAGEHRAEFHVDGPAPVHAICGEVRRRSHREALLHSDCRPGIGLASVLGGAVHLALVALIVVSVTVLLSLAGTHFGGRLRNGISDPERSQLVGLEASLLGLLALLLGFSFAMAESRYEQRKQLVVDEANAIGTARLRTAAVPADPGDEIARLLEEYVAIRVRGYEARDDATLRRAVAESRRLHGELWAHASTLARRDPHSLPAALLLQALNDVFDIDAKRVAAGRNHIPGAVLFALLLVAGVTMGWVGVAVGASATRGTAMAVALSLLISFVVLVIVDLNQPRGGSIRVSQSSLVDLQRSFR